MDSQDAGLEFSFQLANLLSDHLTTPGEKKRVDAAETLRKWSGDWGMPLALAAVSRLCCGPQSGPGGPTQQLSDGHHTLGDQFEVLLL